MSESNFKHPFRNFNPLDTYTEEYHLANKTVNLKLCFHLIPASLLAFEYFSQDEVLKFSLVPSIPNPTYQ